MPRWIARIRTPRPAEIFAAAALAVLAWATLSAFAHAVPVLALAFLASLLASVLSLPIGRLSPPLPRGVATVAVVVTVLAVVGSLVWLSLPIVFGQGRELIRELPAILENATDQLRRWFPGEEGDGGTGLGAALRAELTAWLTALLDTALPLARAAVTLVFGIFALVTVAGFLAHRPDVYVGGFLRLLPGRYQPRLASFVARLGFTIQRWMLGALISMTAVGILTALGLRALGLEPWLALGMLAFFLEFVPYLGPIVSGAAAATVALGHSTEKALWVVLLFVAIQQFESNLLTPLVMKRVIRLQPALLLVWQLSLATIFGLPGVIVATPLLACVHVAVQHFWLEPREGSPPPPSPGGGAPQDQGSGSGTRSGPIRGSSGSIGSTGSGGAAGATSSSACGSRVAGGGGTNTPLGSVGAESTSTREASNRDAPVTS